MANPQPDTFIKINPEIMDALCRTRIPGEARQVLDTIIRKTWGWNKREDVISLSQICINTGLTKVHVCRGINTLTAMNLVITQKGNDIGNIYRFNKDFDTWKSLPKKVTLPKKVMTVTQKGNTSLPKKVPTIDTYTKDTVTIDNKIPTVSCEQPRKSTLNPAQKHFYDTYKARFGNDYVASFGKDGAIFKGLKIIPPEELIILIDKFFSSTDKYIINSGYTVGCFKSQINKLRKPDSTLGDAGMSTLMAGKKWLERSGET